MLRKKILVIDDEKDIRESVIEILVNSGYSAIPAIDGRQAINILNQEIPDLVICDVMMPVIDGFQVLEYFRGIKGSAGIPFIFLTAKIESTDIQKGLKLGADEYITKPFRMKELLEAVDSRLK